MHLTEAYTFYAFWRFSWFNCCLARPMIFATYLCATKIIQLVLCADIKYIRYQVEVVHDDRSCLVKCLLIVIDPRTETDCSFRQAYFWHSFSYYFNFLIMNCLISCKNLSDSFDLQKLTPKIWRNVESTSSFYVIHVSSTFSYKY